MPLPFWGRVLHHGKLQGKEELTVGWCDMIQARIQFSAFGVLAGPFHHIFHFKMEHKV